MSSKKIKIVVLGCQQICVDFLIYLNSISDIEVSLVVTYELPLDKTYNYKSVLEEAGKMGLDVVCPSKLTTKFIDKIESIEPNFIFSVYYRKILPKRLLNLCPGRCINIHPSKLPEYRGPVPTAWAIANGEKECGISIHLMDEGIDTGDLLVQEVFPIDTDDTGFSLYTKAMSYGAKLLKKHFRDIVECKITPQKQLGLGSYYGKLRGASLVNWQKSVEQIINIIRVYAEPFNRAETMLYNKYLFINKASACYDNKYPAQGVGRIVDILGQERLVISCADGCLILNEFEIFPKLNAIEKDIYLKIGNQFKIN